MFNTSWTIGEVPDDWKRAITVPILKPGKDKSDAGSYRPISLLPCLGKLMERVVKRRLEWFIEENELLSLDQYGFRKGKSTLDCLLQISQNISESLANKEHCLVVYLDLKSAYDKIHRRGLIYKLALMGIKGNMLKWISSYLSNRTSKVRVAQEVSDEEIIENGVPQGAVLSPILFNVMFNLTYQLTTQLHDIAMQMI